MSSWPYRCIALIVAATFISSPLVGCCSREDGLGGVCLPPIKEGICPAGYRWNSGTCNTQTGKCEGGDGGTGCGCGGSASGFSSTGGTVYTLDGGTSCSIQIAFSLANACPGAQQAVIPLEGTFRATFQPTTDQRPDRMVIIDTSDTRAHVFSFCGHTFSPIAIRFTNQDLIYDHEMAVDNVHGSYSVQVVMVVDGMRTMRVEENGDLTATYVTAQRVFSSLHFGGGVDLLNNVESGTSLGYLATLMLLVGLVICGLIMLHRVG